MRDFRRTLALLLIAAFVFIYPRLTSGDTRGMAEPTQKTRARSAGQRAGSRTARRPRVDYSKFSHRTAAHRISCGECHQAPTENWQRARAGDAFPDVTDYPDHPACVRCHRQQFFRGARPVICTVCHNVVSPRNGSRFAFRNPNERESASGARKAETPSQFDTVFPHDVHQDVMARRGTDSWRHSEAQFVRVSFQQTPTAPKRIDSCTICHQTHLPQNDSEEEAMPGRPSDVDEKLWPKKGTFKTTPETHGSCFNCHWKEGGSRPLASDCAACHNLTARDRIMGDVPPPKPRVDIDADQTSISKIADEQIRAKWTRRKSARFRHETSRHDELGCTSCHIYMTTVNTLDEATLRVPILTCGGTGTGCHIRARPKGILNDEVEKRRADASFGCAKCHMNLGRFRLPQSHAEAVPTPKPATPPR